VTFEASPGKMQLRISVEGPQSQTLDSEIREMTIPDLTAPQAAIGTPEVFRARTLRAFEQLKADPEAVPVASREFSRTERVLVRVAAYGPGGQMPALEARLLNRAGQAMSALSVTTPPELAGRSQIEVPLSGLAPGEYVIEITARGADGETKEFVGIRVTA
jgi:hypothetical protein